MRIKINEVREFNEKKVEVVTIFGTGNLTADIETRTVKTKKGSNIVAGGKKQSIALDYREGGEKKTEFFKVEAWGKTAELLGQFGKSGTHLSVYGRFKEEPYITTEGKDGISKILVIEYFELAPKMKGEHFSKEAEVKETLSEENDDDSDFVPIEEDDDLPF